MPPTFLEEPSLPGQLRDLDVRSVRRRWLWAIVALVGLTGTMVATARLVLPLIRLAATFFQQPLNEQSAHADVNSMFLEAAALLVSVAALVLALLQLRQGSRARRSLTPQARREQQALDQLRVHLGRQQHLLRIGDPVTRALTLRVHPAIDLPPSKPGTEQPAVQAQPGQAGWRHLSGLRLRRGHQTSRLDPDLPMFVDRDRGPKIRAWLVAARDSGGFLVLVGNSSVGKTRLLYETAREVLPEFRVLAPDLGEGELVNQLASASFALPRLLVWLDELQRFLDGPYLTPGSAPITAATVRRLMDAPTPVVLVGTLWPEYVAQLRASDSDPATGQSRTRYPNAVDVLDDRRVYEMVLGTFSASERQAAARLAASDPRLATALADRDYNVTEVLAGARELDRRYERGTKEQQAVIHAAVDARRLGLQGSLTRELLCAAARGYLTSVHPDDRWFEAVLNELSTDRRPQDRATAPLLPVPDPDRSRVLGYTVADYLLQRLARQRRSLRVPPTTWQAFIAHTSDYDDLEQLAYSADQRLLSCYAVPIYRRLADEDEDAKWELAWRLAEQGRIDELRARAENGDESAAERLPTLLVKQGHIDEATELLQVRADTDDRSAMNQLVELLAEHGRIDEAIELLQARADEDDWLAHHRLIELLTEEGRIDQLRIRVTGGDWLAARQLPGLLAKHGHIDEGIELLRVRSETGDTSATSRLAQLQADQGRIDEAIELLQARADEDDWLDTEQLVKFLADRGRIDELRLRADSGHWSAARQLARLLVERGLIEELRARADNGDRLAAARLVGLLGDQGRIDELRARADNGDELAAQRLPILLGDLGRIDELRLRADTGDLRAAYRLAKLLVERGLIEELRARADNGDDSAAKLLPILLAKQGDIDGAIALLRARADTGNEFAAEQLIEFLAKHDRIDELRIEVDAGTPTAAERLITSLARRGELDQAEQLRRWGLNPDGSIATAEDMPKVDKMPEASPRS
jgi:hypothetical protein